MGRAEKGWVEGGVTEGAAESKILASKSITYISLYK